MIIKGTAVQYKNKIGIYWPEEYPFTGEIIIYNDGSYDYISSKDDLTEIKLHVGDTVHIINDLHQIIVNERLICGSEFYSNWQRFEGKDAVITNIDYNMGGRLSYLLDIDSGYKMWCSLFFDILNNNSSANELLNKIYKSLGR